MMSVETVLPTTNENGNKNNKNINKNTVSENQVDIGPLLKNDDEKDFQNSFEDNTDFSKNSIDTSSLEKEQLANNFEFDIQTKTKEKENEVGDTTLFFSKTQNGSKPFSKNTVEKFACTLVTKNSTYQVI